MAESLDNIDFLAVKDLEPMSRNTLTVQNHLEPFILKSAGFVEKELNAFIWIIN